MAAKKKLFNYEFSDGWQRLPSSYKATCTLTGEIVPIYHKFLVKLIQTKYKNSFKLFEKTYASKGAVKQQRIDDGYDETDPYQLNAYSDYLIASYKACLNVLQDNENINLINKTKTEMSHITDCFERRFNRKIELFIMEK
jgi:DNA modification methylase